MILTRQDLLSSGLQQYHEEVIFKEEDFKSNPLIISVDELHAYVESNYVSSLNMIKIRLEGELTLHSTRSLKPVKYELEIEDDMILAFQEDNDLIDENIILFKEDELNLTPIFYSMLIASIPLKVLADDEEELISGDKWEVITEDAYNSRKKEEDNPFASLADIDFDE